MAYNTVGGVINRAIEIAQLDSGFLPLARQYFNLSLNDLVTNFDWPYYRSQATDQPFTGALSYDLPTDYSRSDTCYLVDSNGNATPITIISKYRFDKLKTSTITGDPRIAYIDLTNRLIVFNCAPNSVRYYRLTYFRKPDQIDEQGGDDDQDIDFENPRALIYTIVAMLCDYTDDERSGLFMQKADKEIHDDKMNAWDEDNDPKIELGPNFRSGSRPVRGSGGFNFGF